MCSLDVRAAGQIQPYTPYARSIDCAEQPALDLYMKWYDFTQRTTCHPESEVHSAAPTQRRTQDLRQAGTDNYIHLYKLHWQPYPSIWNDTNTQRTTWPRQRANAQSEINLSRRKCL